MREHHSVCQSCRVLPRPSVAHHEQPQQTSPGDCCAGDRSPAVVVAFACSQSACHNDRSALCWIGTPFAVQWAASPLRCTLISQPAARRSAASSAAAARPQRMRCDADARSQPCRSCIIASMPAHFSHSYTHTHTHFCAFAASRSPISVRCCTLPLDPLVTARPRLISTPAMQLARRSTAALAGVSSRRTLTVAPASMLAASSSLLHSLAAPRAAAAASAAPSLLSVVRPVAAVAPVAPRSIRFFASITLTSVSQAHRRRCSGRGAAAAIARIHRAPNCVAAFVATLVVLADAACMVVLCSPLFSSIFPALRLRLSLSTR